MGLNPGHAFIETYIALVAYIVLHQIYVIAGDFIEAFNIPPLNIGIYIDKLASVRALLMAIADILEWAITQKGLHDPGSFKKLEDGSARRIGSVMSFIAMLICRFYYMWVVYYSDNKSLVAFITLSVEGFWFGVFQMGFFAIGPEYNAFTSFALHLTGNFVFFFQTILESMAETRPHINSLYRVRVHGWISVVTTFVALPPWLFFCHEYIQGDSPQYKELVEELQAVSVGSSEASNIAQALAKAVKEGGTSFKNLVTQLKIQGGFSLPSENLDKDNLRAALDGAQTQIKDLIEKEFGINDATVSQVTPQGNKVTVTIGGSTHTGSSVVKRGVSTDITILVQGNNLRDKDTAEKIARRLVKVVEKAKAAGRDGEYNPGAELVKEEFGLSDANVTADTGSTPKVKVQIGGGSQLVHSEKVMVNGTETTIEIEVKAENGKISKAAARRICRRLAKTLTQVDKVKVQNSSPANVTVTMTQIKWYNSLSPFLLFPLGSFFKDFMYPGILPYAFLDSEKANFINYTMPILYMCGPVYILLVNDVFSAEKSILGTRMKDYDSKFKEWSEGKAPGYHAFWLLNIPMFMVYLISLFAIHGIYPSLRVIVQSRWRVFVLTMVVLIPRSHLEVMDYVGVANYAIAAGDAGDFEGFTILSWNDMLSMFCRFCNGKLAVGYNWTRVSLGYDFQRDPCHYPQFPVL